MLFDFSVVAAALQATVINIQLSPLSDGAPLGSNFSAFIQICFAINSGSFLLQEKILRDANHRLARIHVGYLSAPIEREDLSERLPDKVMRKYQATIKFCKIHAAVAAFASAVWLYALDLDLVAKYILPFGFLSPILLVPAAIYVRTCYSMYNEMKGGVDKIESYVKTAAPKLGNVQYSMDSLARELKEMAKQAAHNKKE